jgi:hypothetical protein
MGRVHVIVSDEAEKMLRLVVASKKGNLGKFVDEAIKEKILRDKESSELVEKVYGSELIVKAIS